MATIPSTEVLLLEVHQSLGLSAPKKKNELIRLERPFETHQKIISDLVIEIFQALNVDEQAMSDALKHLLELLGANNQIERLVWTREASTQQIAWNMAAYLYAPYLGRIAAFWSVDQTLDAGMPGGKFWYLPAIIERNNKKELHMPVPQVLDWLLDLLGQNISELARGLAGKVNAAEKSIHVGVEQESIERVLESWANGVVPRVGNIDLYFSNIEALTFNGAFKLNTNLSFEEKFLSTLKFIQHKKLSAELLREQIPMTQANRIEKILNGQADEEEKKRFVELIAIRYAVPTLQTLRQRFLVARAVQDGYFRLGKFLSGNDFDKSSTDFSTNKVLQLFGIYQFTYNLTVEAYKHCDDQLSEEAYFESKIPIWDRDGIFLSIMPSIENKVELLASRLNYLFLNEYQGRLLNDHFANDIESAKLIAERNITKLCSEQKENDSFMKCLQKLRTHSPWRILQGVDSYFVANRLASDNQNSFKIRQLAAMRMRELANSPQEKMGAICIELHHLLNNDDRKYRDKDAKKKVESLLKEAKANPALDTWAPMVLQFEAKHHLAFNDFENARCLFKEALDACKKTGFGSLRGEIARDGFALVVAQPPIKYNLNNYEYYFRNVLVYSEYECSGRNVTFEDTACAMSTYFWETLYQPYPNEARSAYLSQELSETFIKGTMPLILRGDFDGLFKWFNKNPTLKDKKFREVHENTALMTLLKTLFEFDEKFYHSSPHKRLGIKRELEMFISNLRKAVCLLINMWPKLVNMSDWKRQTPAMLAANHGDIIILNALIEKNADLRMQDFYGRTALHAAIASNSLKCVEAILSKDQEVANIYADDNQSVLHTAVKFGQPEIAKTLISSAPQLNYHTDTDGKSALDIAEHLAIPSIWQQHHKFMSGERRTIATLVDFEKVYLILSTHRHA